MYTRFNNFGKDTKDIENFEDPEYAEDKEDNDNDNNDNKDINDEEDNKEDRILWRRRILKKINKNNNKNDKFHNIKFDRFNIKLLNYNLWFLDNFNYLFINIYILI